MSDQSSVVPVKVETASEAGKDPLRVMIEIAENDNLSDQDKSAPITTRKPASLIDDVWPISPFYALVVSLALLFIAAGIDSFRTCPKDQDCSPILESIKNGQTLITWLEGFLTAIVAAYYGVSAWRPAS